MEHTKPFARSAQPDDTEIIAGSGASASPSAATESFGTATTKGAAETTSSAGSSTGSASDGSTRGMGTALGELIDRHAALMEARGLDLEILWRLGVESVVLRTPGEWVRYPYVVAGKIVNHKYRRLDQKDFRQNPKGLKCFWNFDVITDPSLRDEPLIITEGEDDAIVLMEAGFQRVVSVPDGAPAQEVGDDSHSRKYEYIQHAAEALKPVERIILATDNDMAGLNLRNDLAIRLGKGRCQYVDWQQHKDARATRLDAGMAAVRAAVERARWMQVSGLFMMSELPPVPDPKIYEIGISGLHEHYNIRRGDFCVVTGVPGHGKSTFLNDVACRMAYRHKWGTCFASFEQFPQIDHRRALRTWFNRKPEHMQKECEIEAADQFIDDWFTFIVPPDDEDATLPWLLDRAAASIIRHGTNMLIIDPWNEMDHARPKDMSLTEYVGAAIREMKKFAREYNIHLVVAAHPSKMSRDKEGVVPVPSLYDISDSSHWFNKPDVGIVVHRDSPHTTLVRVCKSRYHDKIGKPGEIKLLFNPSAARYESA